MNQYTTNNYQQEHELGWDDEIRQDAQEFILLPDGDYDFMVESVERSRFSGSEKMPTCNIAKVKLKIENQIGSVSITQNLMLYSKVEWKLSEFFGSLGMKKKDQPLRMNWNIAGKKGRCKVGHREYNGNTYNEIKKFYYVEDTPAPTQAYQHSYPQQGYAAHSQQPQPNAQYTPGKW